MSIVKGFRIFGWPCFRIPPTNALSPLMNTSFLMGSKALKIREEILIFLSASVLSAGENLFKLVKFSEGWNLICIAPRIIAM